MLTKNKGMIAAGLLFLGLHLLLAACRSVAAPLSDRDVDALGQQLAAWADSNCVTIWIDEAPIQIEDGNAGGSSRVWWQHPEGQAFAERGDEMPEAIRPGAQAWHERNLAVRAHLAQLLEKSDCDLPGLLQAPAQFGPEAPSQDVAAQLFCLGEIRFEPVERGVE